MSRRTFTTDPLVKLEIFRCQRRLMNLRDTWGILRSKNMNVSRKVIRYWSEQYHKGIHEVGDTEKRVPLRQITTNDLNRVQTLFSEDPTRSSSEIHRELKENGSTMSLSSAKRAIRLAGYTSTTPRYCQMIRHVNKEKRVNFCKRMLEADEHFSDVIFSDECTVQLHTNKVTFYRPVDSARGPIPKPKHPLKIHVWAAISKRGASRILVFDGIMDGPFFADAILKDTLLPFIQSTFPDSHRFQQDNDPKHRSRVAKDFMRDNGINWWNDWPSESADLNPIEMVWNQLKRHLARQSPKSKEELQNHVHAFWNSFMTVEQCTAYIEHLYKVIPVCILNEGKATADLPKTIFRESSRGKSISYFNNKLMSDEFATARLKVNSK